MDKRLYFVVGDLVSNIAVGALVAWLCCWLFSPGWNMFLAMFVAMFVGMLLATVLWLPASIYFGAMEVMTPLMLTGMVSGMVVGMWAAMMPIGVSMALFVGAVSGLVTIVAVWIANEQLRGVTTYSTTTERS